MSVAGNLPVEILSKIFAHGFEITDEDDRIEPYTLDLQDPSFNTYVSVEKAATLASCAAVCKRWRQPAQDALFRRVQLGTPKARTKLENVLMKRKDLAAGMESLAIKFTTMSSPNSGLLSLLPNLKAYSLNLAYIKRNAEQNELPTSRQSRLKYFSLALSFDIAGKLSRDPIHRLPRSIERLDLWCAHISRQTVFDLPLLSTLCIDGISAHKTAYLKCRQLRNLVLSDGVPLVAQEMLDQIGHRFRYLQKDDSENTGSGESSQETFGPSLKNLE